VVLLDCRRHCFGPGGWDLCGKDGEAACGARAGRPGDRHDRRRVVILYTEKEGGEWIPFNTPMSVEEIHDNLWKQNDDGMIVKEEGLYYPHSDVLPILHSILLPDASRWDAVNWEWISYHGGTYFKIWRAMYLEYYKPGHTDPRFWWLDQGPVRGIKGLSKPRDMNLVAYNEHRRVVPRS